MAIRPSAAPEKQIKHAARVNTCHIKTQTCKADHLLVASHGFVWCVVRVDSSLVHVVSVSIERADMAPIESPFTVPHRQQRSHEQQATQVSGHGSVLRPQIKSSLKPEAGGDGVNALQVPRGLLLVELLLTCAVSSSSAGPEGHMEPKQLEHQQHLAFCSHTHHTLSTQDRGQGEGC